MKDTPEYSKAAILVEQNKPLIVDYVKLPQVLLVGQILVEIEVSGICGSQIGEITGAKGPDKYLPHLMGHEGCGIVLEIGPGVTTVKKGDKVVLHWRKGDGIQAKNAVYEWNDKVVNAGWVTTFNTHAVINGVFCLYAVAFSPMQDNLISFFYSCDPRSNFQNNPTSFVTH
jgi:D-arabinose 1-dehydrogenase-like Zn-dependent alcohol dehydrogenase